MQTPPMGFKEQEQHHQATSVFDAGADPKAHSHLSTNTQMAQTTEVDCNRAAGSERQRDVISAKPSPLRPAPSRHSPRALQAGFKGGGRVDKPLELGPNRYEKTTSRHGCIQLPCIRKPGATIESENSAAEPLCRPYKRDLTDASLRSSYDIRRYQQTIS
jgi:hypothetical protein